MRHQNDVTIISIFKPLSCIPVSGPRRQSLVFKNQSHIIWKENWAATLDSTH